MPSSLVSMRASDEVLAAWAGVPVMTARTVAASSAAMNAASARHFLRFVIEIRIRASHIAALRRFMLRGRNCRLEWPTGQRSFGM